MKGLKERSDQFEIMDDMTMSGPELKRTLDLLASINLYLGGNALTLNGIEKMMASVSKEKPIRIVDLGCGNGDMLRKLHVFGKKMGYDLELLGIDANPASVAYASELSAGMENVSFSTVNIFSPEFREMEYDIAIATLFMHHFSDEEITELISGIKKKSSIGVLVNDLHRSELAYALFWVISLFFGNHVARNDGLISIRKSFRRKDLEKYAQEVKGKSSIQWRWAFRYQWIITHT
jgi:2-polyprenyl-3-methyl-5-hydroxy-6-metoxy-1,4-benzoquinol methylase